MINKLLLGENKSKIIVDSGPGSQTIAYGDSTQGFFGEVHSGDFITASALASAVGVSQGAAINHSIYWLKFSLDGRILFVPKISIRRSVSWNHLNSVGVVKASQGKQVTINGYRFSVSLLKGANSDPVHDKASGDDYSQTIGSDWNRIFYPISTTVTTIDTTPKWNLYSDTDLNLVINSGDGSYVWCQETSLVISGDYRVYRGAYYGVRYIGRTVNTANIAPYGWRPVLELVQ